MIDLKKKIGTGSNFDKRIPLSPTANAYYFILIFFYYFSRNGGSQTGQESNVRGKELSAPKTKDSENTPVSNKFGRSITRRGAVNIGLPNNFTDLKSQGGLIELEVSPSDYSESDKILFLQACWRARKKKYMNAVRNWNDQLQHFLKEQLSGVTAARNLLLKRKIEHPAVLRASYIAKFPPPVWKAIPRPAEMVELINAQSQVIKPTRVQMATNISRGDRKISTIMDNSSISNTISSVISSMTQFGANPADKKSIEEALLRGFLLPSVLFL